MSDAQSHNHQQRRSDEITMPTEHARQLTVALSPRQMAHYFQACGGTPWPAAATKQPVCRVLDMKYVPDEQCTLLYQWGEALYIGAYQWQGAPTAPTASAHWLAPLGMWLYDFTQDPALPGLATVLNPQSLTDALQAALPYCQSGAFHLMRCRATPLRYRPGKRCTVQIDLHLRHCATGRFQNARLYGKLYHQADKARAVYSEMQLLHSAVTDQHRTLRCAEAVAFLPELGLVVQAPVPGKPLDLWVSQPERLGTAGQAQLCHRLACAAHALAALHQLDLTTDRLRPATADLSKLGRRAAKVATVAPHFGCNLERLADRLCAQAPASATTDLRIGHGDCKPSQFLLSADQVALLDFDHGGMADPAADVGLFLATLRQSALRLGTKATYRKRGAPWASTAAEAHFLDVYLAASDAPPAFRTRVAWYEALALLRKAWRGFARSPWSPLPDLLVAEALAIVN